MNKGYADIVMEPFLARYEEIKYSCVLEIKYIKAGKGKTPDPVKIRQLKTAAAEQLERYSIDEKFFLLRSKLFPMEPKISLL
jgi:hypothetical protein